MSLIRRTITEETGRQLVDAVDHLSACIADLVDVVGRNTAVAERGGGWTPPERIPSHVLSTPRMYGTTSPLAQALLDHSGLGRHGDDRSDVDAVNDDDTPLIDRETCP